MPTINVSTDMLRAKAIAIRQRLDQSKTAHQLLWQAITTQAALLPSDFSASHDHANNSWNTYIEAQYEKYYDLAKRMEEAADAYERGDKSFQISFTIPD